MKYILLLTFFVGTANVERKEMICPVWACVQRVLDLSRESTTLHRIRVWRQGDEARLNVSEIPLWPPLLDWHPS